ncbi:Uncharacterized RNA pseudouridine synthase YlyB [Desulfosarcina cetonica]|nr:Uncharacterized RNA pseudouridine synthase YlyB [Desulfosarcina cetonica]
MVDPSSPFSFQVASEEAGERLDSFVASRIENCSRSYAAAIIRKGCVLVEGFPRKPGYTLKSGEVVAGSLPAPEVPAFLPEALPLEILYEDDDVLVINKPPGMVVHPAPGHYTGTLVNALMHHCTDLPGISGSLRPGIVHRLDMDTSGALVVAKTGRAMCHLADQFKARRVHKCYLALVYGTPTRDSGIIELPIGRHPLERKRMSVNSRTPRKAITQWRVKDRYIGSCLLELEIQTGRTHQIRVHCQAMGHPVIGDGVYGNRGSKRILSQGSPASAAAVATARRQMLHAWRLQIHHPADEHLLTLEAPLPDDMRMLMKRLKEIANTQKK